jgi:hypothetical protein
MKTIFKLSALGLLAASTNLYAHHPAVDMVDPDVYAMIEENISDVHLAMTFEDMGGDTSDVGNAMEARDDDAGLAMGGIMEDVGAAMEAREEMSAMAEVEPAGPGNSRR